MKTLLSFLTLLCITSSVIAQESYDDLMSKSRRARTTSTILVVAGPVVAAGGIGTLIYGIVQNDIGDEYPVYDNNGYIVGYENKKHNTEIIVGAAGAALGIATALYSIHFSNKASDLKRDARRAKLKTTMDRINIPGLQNGFTSNYTKQFKVSLMIPLGK